MQNEQTPAVGQPLDAESVRLLVKGDWLRFNDTLVCRFEHGQDDEKLCTTFVLDGGDYLAAPIEACTFLGRPGADGWIKHEGGENPAPGMRVDVRFRDSGEVLAYSSEDWDEGDHSCWRHTTHADGMHIIAWRPHTPSTSAHPEPASQGREVRRAEPGWLKRSLDEAQAEKGPGGWLINSADGVWEWTSVRMAGVAAMTEGLPVWSVARGCYEGAALASPTQDEPLGVDLVELRRRAQEVVNAEQSGDIQAMADADQVLHETLKAPVILKLIAEIERRGKK